MTTISASPLPQVAAPQLAGRSTYSESAPVTTAPSGPNERPAAIVSISAEAEQKSKRIIPLDVFLRNQGFSDEKIVEFKAGYARGEAKSIAEDKARAASLEQRRQQDVETALVERSPGAPQALIDAVRGIKDVVGSIASTRGSGYVITKPEIRAEIVRRYGEETLARVDASSREQNALSRAGAGLDAARLSRRFGVQGRIVEADDKGQLQVGNFTLNSVGGDYAVRYDAATAAISILRSGTDVTAAILKGNYFGGRQGTLA